MLTKQSVESFHKDIDAAIKDLCKKHGLSSANSHITYDSDLGTFHFRCDFGDVSQTGGINPTYVKDTRKYGWRYDLKVEDCGKLEFTDRGEKYVVQGMKGGDKVIVKKISTGELYRFKPEIVAKLTGRVPA